MGGSLGITNTRARRDRVQYAVQGMVWVDPRDMCALRDAPVRQVVASLFAGRPEQLRRAGVAELQGGTADQLIGLEDDAGRRYFVLESGNHFEAVFVLLLVPAGQAA